MRATLLHRRVSAADRRALEALARSPTPLAVRAGVVLRIVDGGCPATVAAEFGVPRTTAYSWARRFAIAGVASLAGGRRCDPAAAPPAGHSKPASSDASAGSGERR